MTTPNPHKLYSVKEAAEILGISLKTMWRLIDTRKVSIVKINRRVLISTQGMDEFIKAHTISRLDVKSIAQRFLFD